MHSTLFAPNEANPTQRTRTKSRGLAGFPLIVFLLVSLLGTVVPGFAQTHVANLTATQPTFVALDARTSTTWLYVAEHGGSTGTPPTGGGRILRFNLTTGSATPQVVAARGTANGQFIAPDGILVDSATGDIFVADRYQNRIQRLSVNATTGVGTYVMGWGSGTVGAPDEMHGPVGLARDAAGAIYIAEHGDMNTGNGRGFVSKYTVTATAATRVFRNAGSIGFTGAGTPYGIAVNGSTLLVSDGFNSRVQVWDLAGNSTGSWAVGGDIPLGLSVDTAGTVWIAVSSGGGTGAVQQIERRTVAGVSAGASFGSNGGANGQFSLPFHAVLNSTTNRAYVADYGNNRVQVFDMAAPPAPAAPTITSSTTASATVGTAFSYTITGSNSPTSFSATALAGTGLSVNTSTGVISGTPTASGTITSTIGATNATGTGTATLTITVAPSGGGGGGGGGPSISSMTFVAGTPLRFDVVFSEAVTGVDAADFDLQATGSAGASLISVTGSGTTYAVNFSWNGGGPGSIYTRIDTSGTGITGASGAFAGAGVIETHVPITSGGGDGAAPTVTSFTAGTPSGSTVTFTLNFNESIWGLDSSDITLAPGSAAATIGAIAYADATGASYRIPVTFTASSGTIALVVRGGTAGNIRDGNNNVMAASSTSSTFTIGSGGGGGSAPTIANQSTNGTVGTALNYQVVATGATSFSIVGTPALPAGLSMSSTGAITGTPTAAGSTTVNVRATNANGSTNATLTLTIAAAGSAPTIAAQSTSGVVGTALNYQVVATGATSFSLASGTMPAGLSLSTAGVVSGTPSAAASTTVVVRATNANGSNTANLTLNISAAAVPAPTISAQSTSGVVGTALNYQVQATGATSFSLASGTMPPGLSLSSSGAITGTPTAAGATSVTVRATNATGSNTAAVTISIAAAGTPPTISNQTVTGFVGTAVNYQVVANGATSITIVGGALPTGLSMSSSGNITGTPSGGSSASVTVRATNATGSADATLTFAISSTPMPTSAPTIANQSASGVATRFMDYRIVATGATSFSVVPPSELPYALTLDDEGRVAGIPTVAGTTTVTIKATNAAGSSTAQLTITIGNPPPPPPPPPAKTSQTITFVSPVSAIRVGTPIQLGATTSSGLPITYSVISGSATINGSTLTPTSTAALTVRASQAGNATYAAATTDVNFGSPEKSSQVITFPTPGTVLATDTSVNLAATSSSGLPVTYTLMSGAAVINGSTLTLAGEPGIIVVKASQAGNATFNAAADVTVWIAVRSATSSKVYGLGNEVGFNIVHQNGNVYDQVLLTGDYATVTADAGQVTRISFLDMNDDIVQVEFSGAGSLTLVLENPTGPVAPVKYNQTGVMYMKGHASIKISGANETTNVSVFSVGKATAVNQALFPAGMTYDAIADIGLIEISSQNGKFGGVRAANAGFFRASGMTGISAPGVTFTGPVYIGDIDAGANATGTIFLGSATDVSIRGGNLLQQNSRAILINGVTQLTFAAGTKSDGSALTAQPNQARFEGSNGLDLTGQIVR